MAFLALVCTLYAASPVDGQTCAVPESSSDSDTTACPSSLSPHELDAMKNNSTPRNCHRWILNATANHKATLGVLIPIYRLSTSNNSRGCSSFPDGVPGGLGVEMVEAVRFAVEDELARRPSLQRVLGAVEIRDSCFSPRFCVQQAVTLAVSSPQAAHYCRSNFSDAFESLDNEGISNEAPITTCSKTERVAAIVGPGISSTLKVVAPTLSIFQIPHISYWATSDAFSKKREYPYLFRTVPSDDYQARAMVRLLAEHGWTFVVALSSNDEITGGLGLDAFRHAMTGYSPPPVGNVSEPVDMCIAFEERFHHKDKEKVRQIVRRLVKEPKANAVILFAGQAYARTLFTEMANLHSENDSGFRKQMDDKHFVWIASDGWIAVGPSLIYTEDGKQRFGGTHTLLGFVFRVPDPFWPDARAFSSRLLKHIEKIPVTQENLNYNPWLAMRLPDGCNSTQIGLVKGSTQNKSCASISLGRLYPPIESGSLMLAVRAALGMIDTAFNCTNCSSQAGSKLRDIMRNVKSLCNDSRDMCQVFQKFEESREHSQDLQASYLIKNLVLQDDNKTTLETVFEWNMGKDDYEYGYLTWVQNISWASVNRTAKTPPSVCALPCTQGQSRNFDTNDANQRNSRCCWTCNDCKIDNQYAPNISARCQTCEQGKRPNENYTDCEPIPPEYIDYSEPAAIAIISLAAVGICIVIATGLIFHRYRMTKVVHSTGRALSNLLLLSLLLGFISCMVFFNRPSTTSCSFFAILASAVIIFSTITVLVRTLRLANSNQDAESEHKLLRLMNAVQLKTFSAQLTFITAVTAILLLILAIWVAADPFTTEEDDSVANKVSLHCERKWEYSGVVAFILVAIIATTAVMAFQTRKLASEFNEAKLLLFTAFALCVLWIALTPTFFVTDRVLEPVIIALTILAHMLAIWFCLFLPRLYIIILRPQRNPEVVPETEPAQSNSGNSGDEQTTSRWSLSSPLGRRGNQNGAIRAGNGKVRHGSSSRSSSASDSVMMNNTGSPLHKETSL